MQPGTVATAPPRYVNPLPDARRVEPAQLAHEIEVVSRSRIVAAASPGAKGRDLLGLRPGEALACVNAQSASGCGTAPGCEQCGALAAILGSQTTGRTTETECLLSGAAPGVAQELAVRAMPVEVDGAIFSVGDTHAAQGDGEVCGTAIESAIDVALKFDLVKGANLRFPRYVTPGPVTSHFDGKGYEVTTGIGPDLMAGARAAVSDMVELLSRRFGYSPIDAYMLCSVCADLRISSIVDVPNWVVSFYFPRVVVE